MPLQDTDWFLVTNSSGTSRKIQAQNLFGGSADDWYVLVNEGGNSRRCLVSELANKASDSRYMLVNQGSTSYKIKSSVVVDKYGNSFSQPSSDFTHYQLHASQAVTKFGGGTSSGGGNGVIWAGLNAGNSPGDPYYGYTTLDYWYGLVYGNYDADSNRITANMTGRGKVFSATTYTGISASNWKLYRSSEKVARTDILSSDSGAPNRYQGGSYPQRGDTSVMGYFCCGWMLNGNHQYVSTRRWSRNVPDSYQITYVQGNLGSDEVTATIYHNNGGNESTQFVVMSPGMTPSDGEIGFNPPPMFGGHSAGGNTVNQGLFYHCETDIGYNGSMEIRAKGSSTFNTGTPDLLICQWRTQYS